MPEAVHVRCPGCRREHMYEPPTYPCSCGAPLNVPLLRGGVPMRITSRVAGDSWLRMHCPRCGASDEWPQPEYTCACGSVVRLPVDTSRRMRTTPQQPIRPVTGYPPSPRETLPRHYDPRDPQRSPRPPAAPASFRPMPIRTGQDALQTVVRYLLWLGHTGVHISPEHNRGTLSVRGPGVAAQVQSWANPAELRAVELLWLYTLNEAVAGLFFSVAGYTREAQVRAEQLSVALFVLDVSGQPRPVNDRARRFLEDSRPVG